MSEMSPNKMYFAFVTATYGGAVARLTHRTYDAKLTGTMDSIPLSKVVPYNDPIVSDGTLTDEPEVQTAKPGDPCLVQVVGNEVRLIMLTEKLILTKEC